MNASADTPEKSSLLSDEDVKRVREILSFFGASRCTRLSLSIGELKLALEKDVSGPGNGMSACVVENGPAEAAKGEETLAGAEDRVIEAAAHGIFYFTSAEGAPPFVSEGQEIAAGGKIGLLEAMKVFTEVLSDMSGTVVGYLVENGTEVSPGTPLLRVRE